MQLQARRRQLQLELRLIEGELRTDEALRLQAEVRRADARLGCAAAGGSGCGDETNRAASALGVMGLLTFLPPGETASPVGKQ